MSRWQERLEYVESIDLTAVAEEVNARRLRKLREQRLAEGGEVPDELRGDQKCDGPRMQRALQALCRMTGDRRKPFDVVCTHQVLAARMGIAVRTARRAVYDLRDASLLIVDARPFEHRRGGDGANGYRFVWATIVDIALSQGVQLRLPLSVGEVPERMTVEPGSSPETGRPDNPSGCESADPEAARGGPAVPFSTGGHTGGHERTTGGHGGHAGGHGGHAGGHEHAPNAGAGAGARPRTHWFWCEGRPPNAGAGAGARPHGRAPSSRELTEKPPSTPYPLVPGARVVASREGEGGRILVGTRSSSGSEPRACRRSG